MICYYHSLKYLGQRTSAILRHIEYRKNSYGVHKNRSFDNHSVSRTLYGVNSLRFSQRTFKSIDLVFGNYLSEDLKTVLLNCWSVKRYITTSVATQKDKNKNDEIVLKSKSGSKNLLSNDIKSAQLDSEADFDNLSELVDIEVHSEMLQKYHLEALNTQQLLIIQPAHELDSNANFGDTRTQLKLAETLGLIETLGWTSVDEVLFDVKPNGRDNIFFETRWLINLRNHISSLENPVLTCGEKQTNIAKHISAVFVSTFRLSNKQRLILEEILEKPVLDRYNIVLQIFKRHAKSREAMLQSKLAEIPYLKARLQGDYEVELLSKYDPGARKGEKFFASRRLTLHRLERKLRSDIDKVRLHRAVLRKNRTRLEIPSIAIVGYTNAGKTSIIKALTGKQSLRPRNQLFATLDVTVHAVCLPSTLEVLLTDTVGFISDIPTNLIASFNATLEDAALADVLVHVRDMANPDNLAQDNEVKRTLRQLKLPSRLLPKYEHNNVREDTDIGRDVITVGNKIDLLDPLGWPKIKADGMIPVSCTKGYGLDYLLHQIEDAVMKATGRRKMLFKISIANGAEEYGWLRKNTHVIEVTVDSKTGNYWLVNTIVRHFDIEKFEKQFIRKERNRVVEYVPS